jgi:hypothetical protein
LPHLQGLVSGFTRTGFGCAQGLVSGFTRDISVPNFLSSSQSRPLTGSDTSTLFHLKVLLHQIGSAGKYPHYFRQSHPQKIWFLPPSRLPLLAVGGRGCTSQPLPLVISSLAVNGLSQVCPQLGCSRCTTPTATSDEAAAFELQKRTPILLWGNSPILPISTRSLLSDRSVWVTPLSISGFRSPPRNQGYAAGGTGAYFRFDQERCARTAGKILVASTRMQGYTGRIRKGEFLPVRVTAYGVGD